MYIRDAGKPKTYLAVSLMVNFFVCICIHIYIKITTYIPGSVLKYFTYSREAVLADNWANMSSDKICTRDCVLCLERPLQYSYHTTTPYWTQVPKKLSIAEIIT